MAKDIKEGGADSQITRPPVTDKKTRWRDRATGAVVGAILATGAGEFLRRSDAPPAIVPSSSITAKADGSDTPDDKPPVADQPPGPPPEPVRVKQAEPEEPKKDERFIIEPRSFVLEMDNPEGLKYIYYGPNPGNGQMPGVYLETSQLTPMDKGSDGVLRPRLTNQHSDTLITPANIESMKIAFPSAVATSTANTKAEIVLFSPTTLPRDPKDVGAALIKLGDDLAAGRNKLILPTDPNGKPIPKAVAKVTPDTVERMKELDSSYMLELAKLNGEDPNARADVTEQISSNIFKQSFLTPDGKMITYTLTALSPSPGFFAERVTGSQGQGQGRGK